MNHHSLGVDVAHLQIQGLFQTQSQRVHRPKVRHHPLRGASVDQPMDLVDGEHFGQRPDVLEFGVGERFPVSLAGASEEELDA